MTTLLALECEADPDRKLGPAHAGGEARIPSRFARRSDRRDAVGATRVAARPTVGHKAGLYKKI